MKQIITSFFLLFISVGAFCQSEAISINESFENILMPKVFEILKEKYQLKLAYDYESIKGINVNKKINSKSLENALNRLFSNTNLEYQIVENNQILIRKSENIPSAIPLQKYILKGKVTDTNNAIPLAFATIYCPSTNQGCSTDENGLFSLVISSTKSEGTINIQYLGYISRVIAWQAGTDLSNLQIKLQAKTLDFKEVTILEKLPTLSSSRGNGAMILRANKLSTLPSFVGGNDIFRSIQLLPGISANDDLSSELKIRGSNGDENMIILDGITLYKVDHYFGIFSAINPNIINQVKVYKNAFPVEYGGRTAGVIDLSTHQKTKSMISGGLQLNLLTSNAYLSIPITDKMGLFIGGRTTNKNVADTDLFELLLKNEETPNAPDIRQNNTSTIKENPEFRFYDFNVKWLWDISTKTNLSTSFFRSYDKFEYDYQRELFTIDRRRGKVTNTENFDESTEWNNQGISFHLKHEWVKKIKSDINFAYSSYGDSQWINSSLVRISERNAPPKPGIPPPLARIDTAFKLTNRAFNSIQGIELNVKNEWDLNKQQKLTFGYHLVNNQVDINIDVDNRSLLNFSKEGAQHAAYLQYNLKTEAKLNIGLGLRSTYYTITKKNYLSPRLNLSYEVNDDLKFKASCSKYNQFLRKNYREDRFGRSYEFWVLGSENPRGFPVSSSKQCMFGFNFNKNGFELDVEAYYKSMDGIMEYALQKNGFSQNGITPSFKPPRIYKGTGISKGIDFLLKKNAGNYTGWITYTLSKIEHSFSGIDKGNPFPAQDDRRHQLKWINQYGYKQFDFSATYIYSTGRPYTDLSKLTDPKDRNELTPAERISYLADYHRMDMGVSYRFDWGNSKAKVGFSIFNILDRQNVKYRQYIYSLPNESSNSNQRPKNKVTGTELKMLGRTPNISFSLDF